MNKTKTKRPAHRINDRVTLASHVAVYPAYDGKPFVGHETVLRVSSVSGTGSRRNPWAVSVTDDAGNFWTNEPTDFEIVSA
jgi:hypothetical protein